MKITNELDLPSAIVEAVKADPYDPGDSDITVTSLIDPPQITALKRRHADELVEDASDRIWSLMGQVAHAILERADVSALTERRLYATVDGWKLGGQFDRLVLLPEGLLQDYKLASVWEWIFGIRPERAQQLNVLAWLARQNGYAVDDLEIVMIFRDWSMSKAEREQNYPERQVARIPIPMWDDDQILGFIRHRLADQQQALHGEPRECTDEERWARSDKWAVMKEGRKSAVRVYKTREQAEQHIAEDKDAPKLSIEHRPGENVRCRNYCPVGGDTGLCPQWERLRRQEAT